MLLQDKVELTLARTRCHSVMVKIGKETQCCISIAERPGNVGANLFNAAFEAKGLNFFYKPFQLSPEHLEDAVRGIRALGIRGCGVSMPHKTEVIKYLDEIDPIAAKIKAVNTILNDGGRLKGYNTDYSGAEQAIAEKYPLANKKVLIVGAGGVARALTTAVQHLQAGTVMLANRREENGRALAQEFGIEYVSFKSLPSCDLLINATSVGMAPNMDESIVDEPFLASCEAVMDVVTNPLQSKLLKSAEDLGKVVIPGILMALYGAAAQFELYTGEKAPLDVMRGVHFSGSALRFP